jgi:hypothetical protein
MSTKHTDIVEWLRKPTSVRDKDLREAADIIIELRVENRSANAASACALLLTASSKRRNSRRVWTVDLLTQ